MPESTARAERFESQNPSRPFYVWEVLQKPVSVRICLDVVERLERDVIASFRCVSNRGSEVGGLLLGRVVPGSRPVISVEDYEPIPCDYSRGPLYRLSEGDLANLDEAFRRRTAGADRGLAVVGVYRSNTRKELAADQDDLSLMKSRFNRADQVLLLVKPFATKPALAGFFVWEDGAIRETSYLEFPFTRAALVAANSVRAIPVESPAPPEEASPPPPEGRASEALAPAEPPAPKAAARAQVVPIASRRDAAAPPLPAPEPEPPPAVEPAPAAPEPQPAEEAEVPPEKAPEFAIPPAGRGRGKLILILGGMAAAVVAVVLLLYPGLLIKTGPDTAAPGIDTSSLALRVERSAGQLLLTWNREAEAVKTATKAVLTISDGPQQENVELDLAQLRNGSVVYSPATADVSFRLELTGGDQATSRSEHVRVLGARPSPMAPPEAAAAKPAPAPEAALPEQGQEPPAAVAEPAAPARPRESLSARWTEPASLGQRLRPALPSDIPEPPSLTRAAGMGQSPAGIPIGLSSAPPPPAPAPPPAAAPASTPSSAAGQRVGGQVQEAVLVSRREPLYPPLARQSRVQGVVHLEATVARDGRVTGVKVVSGHPLLREAAAEAVKHWVYRPALLNGQTVEVTTRVTVGFSLQ